MIDFTIIIPHRGNALGLWATIASCDDDLLRSGFNYNYVIVPNGEEKLHPDTRNTILQLKGTGRLLASLQTPHPVGPPLARQMGAEVADGKYLFFFDNHCVVSKDYFKRAIMDFDKYGMDMLHSTTQYYSGVNKAYHYKLRLKQNFWAEAVNIPKDSHKPYRIAVGGHGGFAIKAATWHEVGGYGPKELFLGYGGEEVYFDMKMWMMGKTIWLDPLMLHYHYAGSRGYSRHYTDEYYVNMLVCANVIGGEKSVYEVFNNFTRGSGVAKNKTDKGMYDLLLEAMDRSKMHASEMAVMRHRTLEQQLEWFSSQDIPW